MSDTPINEKVVDKIRKLFSLSSSPNEAEAASALEKAHQLLKEHNLALSDIAAPKDSGATRFTVEGTHEQMWRSRLLHILARSNFCALITIKSRGSFTYQIFGREANIATTMEMFDYLVSTMSRLVRRAKEIMPEIKNIEFLFGMVNRIGERLEEMRKAEEAEGCTALVVVSNEAAQAMHKEYPYIRARNMRSDKDGYSNAMGRQTADSISLHKQVGGGSGAPSLR